MSSLPRVTSVRHWYPEGTGFSKYRGETLTSWVWDDLYSDSSSELLQSVSDGLFWVHHKKGELHPPNVELDSNPTNTSIGAEYRGPIFPEGLSTMRSGGFDFAPDISSEASLNAFGTSAIARVAPTRPQFSIANLVGELKLDGVPKLIGSSFLFRDRSNLLGGLEAVAAENLNYQFGWKPLLGDISSLARIVADSSEAIQKYRQEAAREIRRQYHELETIERDTVTVYPNRAPYPAPTYLYSATGTLTKTVRTTRKRWFVGHFCYGTPLADASLERLRRNVSDANHLLGFVITPEVIWNLTPWTWALDWFSNVGDVVSALSSLSTDGLVMRNGWVMEGSKTTVTWSLAGHRLRNGTSMPTLDSVFYNEHKRRVPATPFGFGFDMSALSDRQIGILVSLGLTKGVGARRI